MGIPASWTQREDLIWDKTNLQMMHFSVQLHGNKCSKKTCPNAVCAARWPPRPKEGDWIEFDSHSLLGRAQGTDSRRSRDSTEDGHSHADIFTRYHFPG